MNRNIIWTSLVALCVLIAACNNNGDKRPNNSKDDSLHLFTLLPPDSTHIDFTNSVVEGPNTNVLLYEYFYNGGGVAVGDVNNDGLQDIYFSSNLGDNKLYLNKGGMQFQDVTAATGLQAGQGHGKQALPWRM